MPRTPGTPVSGVNFIYESPSPGRGDGQAPSVRWQIVSLGHLPRSDEGNNEPVLPLEPQDYKIAVKYLERRLDEDQYYCIGEPASGGPPPRDKDDRWREWVLCVIRNFDHNNEPLSTHLQIKSPFIKALLKRVIGDKYPGVSFSTEAIKLEFPLTSLYHYLKELHEATKGLEGLEREHADFFMTYLDDEFKETVKEVTNLTDQGLITYRLLWTLFKPGKMVYTPTDEEYHMRVYRHYEGNYVPGECPHYRLSNEFVTYDGMHFGMATACAAILEFSGARKIKRLSVFPLEWHPHEDHVREKLIARGRRFEELRGKQYCQYTGITLGEVDRQTKRPRKNAVNGAVMIDCEMFGRMAPDRVKSLKSHLKNDKAIPNVRFADATDSEVEEEYESADEGINDTPETEEPPAWRRKEDPKTYRPLTAEQHLMADCMVFGFAFSEKLWVQFHVDLVKPPQWNDKAFDQLVLPPAQKALVRALVDSHVRGRRPFDDFIKGKGRGLVALLHGPPGVGKTLTAESVAHASRRPLYSVSSGELGVDAKELEKNLARILDVASAWKAVVLLDEADVFLEKRSQHDLNRNALVSIFLRLLEYYQGILFLTTNRVKTFDEAFQSRIHIALKYSNLEVDARRSVWRNFLERAEGIDIGDWGYDQLARHDLNGREIKNAIVTAKILADAEGTKLLDLHMLEVVLGMQQEF